MYSEGLLSPQYSNPLQQAVSGNSLFSVRSITSPFSAYTDKSVLSYAESFSLVDFLISQYGAEKMRELLSTFEQGITYDGAFMKVYGFDMDGLDALWRPYVKKLYS
jgi:hypothetical protein